MSAIPVPRVVPGGDSDEPDTTIRPGDDSPLQQPVHEPEPAEGPDEK